LTIKKPHGSLLLIYNEIIMSNQENNKSNSSPSKTNLTDKGKEKSISAISNSATALLRETLIPSSGTSTASALNSLIQQKPQSSSTSTSAFLHEEEWRNSFSQQDKGNNTTIRSQTNSNISDIDRDWKQWIPEHHNIENIDVIDPCPSAKLIMYPFHHHYPHKTNENTKDGRELLDFLNSNNYTDQIYEDFNQLTMNRQKDYCFLGNSKFSLEEFLESKDIQEYLLKTSYTDDVYGIPIFLKELIDKAKSELNDNQNVQSDNDTLKYQKTAIERLKMVREHLIERRKLNNNNNNNNIDDNKITTGNNNRNDELSNNWLDNWTEQDMKHIWE
jgi:hypothetical protein